MILLTGATGVVGRALLPLLLERGARGPRLVRDPRRLGPQRVDVQIALGDLADLGDPRVAAPGAARRRHRDPPRGGDPRPAPRAGRGAERRSATAPAAARRRARRRRALRLLLRARRDRVPAHPLLPRQGAGRAGGRRPRRSTTTVFAPSIVYDRGDPWVTLHAAPGAAAGDADLRRGRGRATSRSGPRDVARCVVAALERGDGDARRYELAGPERPHLRRDRAAVAARGRARAAARPRPAAASCTGPRRAAPRWSATPSSPPGRRPS